MKVVIISSVNVDSKHWARRMGIPEGPSRDAVREDVRYYFRNYIQERIDHLGLAPDMPLVDEEEQP